MFTFCLQNVNLTLNIQIEYSKLTIILIDNQQMKKKMLKKEILQKIVRDNALHKILANKFEFTEKRVEQWFYRELIRRNAFSKVYNYCVVLEIATYLKMNTEELFEEGFS